MPITSRPFAYTYNPVGISGYSGISGAAFVGSSGYSGYTGYSGESGWSGYSGYSSFSGYSGESGWSGYTGISGYTGFSGYSGWSGYSGFSGLPAIGITYYYTNSAADFGDYDFLGIVPEASPESYFETTVNQSSANFVDQITLPLEPDQTVIPIGTWAFNSYVYSDNAGDSYLTYSVYVSASDGSQDLLFKVDGDYITNTDINNPELQITNYTINTARDVEPTSRIVIKVDATTSTAQNRTVRLYYLGSDHYSHVSTGIYRGAVGTSGISGYSGYSGIGFSGADGPSGYSGFSGAFAGSGTSGTVPVFTGDSSLGNSTIVDNGVTATATSYLSAISGFVYDTADISNRLYVSEGGSDNNNGLNPTQPLASIKKACAIAAANPTVKYTIFLGSGTYTEINPIYLPPNTSIIGDNLRRCTIIPVNKQLDIIWLNNACYVWGVTFRQHLAPAAACAFPNINIGDVYQGQTTVAFENTAGAPTTLTGIFYDAFTSPGVNPNILDVQPGWLVNGTNVTNAVVSEVDSGSQTITIAAGNGAFQPGQSYSFTAPYDPINASYEAAYNTSGYEITAPTQKPFTTTSPYVQGSSSITSASGSIPAGAGLRVDGNLVRGYLRSFVIDSYTQYNQGGMGIHITNNGYAQLVSTFTICTTEGVRADNGGTVSINTSNCSFGLSGLVADGYSTSPVLTATLASDVSAVNNLILVTAATPRPPSAYDCPVDNPYVGLVFTIDGDMSNTLYTIGKVTLTDSATDSYTITIVENAPITIAAGALVKFYIRSTITTSAHTMEYVGSGTDIASAVPALGGVGNPDNEAVAANGGAVYYTSTNQLGNFRVGSGFTVVQSTGTIEGETFNKSILSLVTPLTLALE